MECKIAHLTFIQGVINRMGQNSFFIKGWSVTIVVALFALAAQNSNKLFVLAAFLPVVMFWSLDRFFLYQERLFRKLYEKVANEEIDSNTFTLDTRLVSEDVERCVAFSKTLMNFHGSIVVTLILVLVFL
ncbi:hypothetical protein [Oceanisphaera sp. W20_SRM_FM3]|uniref:hypothetical protein n=1 Tax=Oceanisphaera sp. W20_SRM_FM3 TaxID=3240267 RepID=UPI003F9490D1